MQPLEDNGAVRPIYGSLGVKTLKTLCRCIPENWILWRGSSYIPV